MRKLIVVCSLILFMPAAASAATNQNLKLRILPQNCLFDVIEVGAEQEFYFHTPESCGLPNNNPDQGGSNTDPDTANGVLRPIDAADEPAAINYIDELLRQAGDEQTSQNIQRLVPVSQSRNALSKQPETPQRSFVLPALVVSVGAPLLIGTFILGLRYRRFKNSNQ